MILPETILPETEHFRIVHSPWNAGTREKEYAIHAKAKPTYGMSAALPPLAKADSPELLVEHLHEAETWYVENRKMVEQYGSN